MTTLSIELPDSLFSELQHAADLRRISMESLLVEMARHNLHEIKAEQHFRERAARGNPEHGLALLEEIVRRSGQ